jgi:hypothetical protein
MPFLFIDALGCLAFFLFGHFLFAFSDYRIRHRIPYPPDPPSWPITSNLIDVPKEAPGVQMDIQRLSGWQGTGILEILRDVTVLGTLGENTVGLYIL